MNRESETDRKIRLLTVSEQLQNPSLPLEKRRQLTRSVKSHRFHLPTSKKAKVEWLSGVFLICVLLASVAVYAFPPQSSVASNNIICINGSLKLQNYDGTSSITIQNLNDVAAFGVPLNNQVLGYNSTTGLWQNMNQTGTGASNSYSMENLTDASYIVLTNGDIPMYNSTSGKWTNQQPFNAAWNATVNALVSSATINWAQISGASTQVNSLISTYLVSNPIAYSSLTGTPNSYATATYTISVNGSNYQAVNTLGAISWSSTTPNFVINNATANSANGLVKINILGNIPLQAPLTIGANNVELIGNGRGTILTLAPGATYQAFNITGFSGVTLQDFAINCSGQVGTGQHTQAGIFTQNSPNLVIDRVYESNAGGIGLDIYDGCNNFKVTNCEFLNNYNDATGAEHCSVGTFSNNYVNNVTLYNAFSTVGSSQVTISNNKAYNCGGDGVGVESNDTQITITGNVFNNTVAGIKFYSWDSSPTTVTYSSVTGNSITNATTGLLILSYSVGNTFEGNTISYITRGIDLEGSNNIVSGNNLNTTLSNHDVAIYITGNNNQVYGNIVSQPINSLSYGFYITGNFNQIHGNTIEGAGGSGHAGIDILAGATDNSLWTNDLSLSGSPFISDSGTYTQYEATTQMVATAATVVGGQVLYDNAGTYGLANAVSSSAMNAVAMTTYNVTGSGNCIVMTKGYFTNPNWSWGTIGGPIYVSNSTAGGLTQTLPATSGNIDEYVGYAVSATEIWFDPNTITIGR